MTYSEIHHDFCMTYVVKLPEKAKTLEIFQFMCSKSKMCESFTEINCENNKLLFYTESLDTIIGNL